jgi:hypothetical protein
VDEDPGGRYSNVREKSAFMSYGTTNNNGNAVSGRMTIDRKESGTAGPPTLSDANSNRNPSKSDDIGSSQSKNLLLANIMFVETNDGNAILTEAVF